MFLTKPLIFLHDPPAGPTPWSAPALRVSCRFSPSSPARRGGFFQDSCDYGIKRIASFAAGTIEHRSTVIRINFQV